MLAHLAGELAEARKAEKTAAHNFAMMKQSLDIWVLVSQSLDVFCIMDSKASVFLGRQGSHENESQGPDI